jgi:hypothetical protein
MEDALEQRPSLAAFCVTRRDRFPHGRATAATRTVAA